ncbi:MAG: hypothetical protein FJX25_09365 [Alphaproteobacteria bacterium]|nr:hypothetical protein [Alphaproteobacteria bacterium]
MDALEQKQAETTVRDNVIITTTTGDDMKLIVSALSAYQHNTRYRARYERLLAQMGARGTAAT